MARFSGITFGLASALFLAACGTPATPPGTDSSAPADLTEFVDGIVFPDVDAGPDLTDVCDLCFKDTEIYWPDNYEFVPEEGGFLWPCNQGDDCDSKFCLTTFDYGQVCTVLCEDMCPNPEWKCKNKPGSDLIFLCVPPEADICVPCNDDDDCGGPNDHCIQVGNKGGHYCSISCQSDTDCPLDYACTTLDHNGKQQRQCLPKSNSCVCIGNIDGTEKACSFENEFGKCYGEQICQGADGWSECSARVPSPEVCDGIDNDCNGDKEEGLIGEACKAENEYGICTSVMVCDGPKGWICPSQVPGYDICDGEDNNCDGKIDENFPGLNLACDSPEDEDLCADGILKCLSDGSNAICEGDLPHVEMCNGLDEDCDGIADDPWPQLNGACDGPDEDYCKNGLWICTQDGLGVTCFADYNQAEVCDGKDNDCNGTADDGFPDYDWDGIADCVDLDRDGDGIDDDGDNSGLATDKPCLPPVITGCDDNCTSLYNPTQADNDKDGQGDACDNDDDNDGYLDPIDNCKLVFNPTQKNTDNDKFGDSCDDDDDNDGIFDDGDLSGSPTDNACASGEIMGCDDNCPLIQNPTQTDTDLDGKGDACDEDDDNDTYLDTNDCQPLNPAVHPGAIEKCDGVDEDCDNIIDPENSVGCNVFYIDADKDNFGYIGLQRCVCGLTGTYPYTTLTPGDCNDSNPDVNPSEAESCNLQDDDCNDVVDDFGAAGCSTYYRDKDKDGWGTQTDYRCACPGGKGEYIATKAGDCDETKANVNPAATEYCNGIDDNCDFTTDGPNTAGCNTYYMDYDGDGYGLQDFTSCLCAPDGVFNTQVYGDCDDSDMEIAPGISEKCDGKDNDCDLLVDEENAVGCLTYYKDFDNDSWGDSLSYRCLCGPDGIHSTLKGGDCDDTDKYTTVGGTEICDFADNDCDGIIDEDATGCQIFYFDADGDGYGNPNQKRCLCQAGQGYTATVAGDCNDSDKNQHPNLVEACNGFDDDCNGIADDVGAYGCFNFYKDLDQDGWGNTFDYKCYCGPTGLYTAVQGLDCRDDIAVVNPGVNEFCDGLDNDCDLVVDEVGADGSLPYYYDADGDGYGVTSNFKEMCAPSGPYSTLLGGDCNDLAFSISPGVPEICDAIDNNCSNTVDEGFPDTDNDGTKDCLDSDKDGDQDPGGQDCDDLDPARNHFAQEKCNGLDDNCDGHIDEENALGCQNYYYDGDVDGYGVNNNFKCLCAALGLYSSTWNNDCNDLSFLINPEGKEQCNGVDDNCNAMTDEGNPTALCGGLSHGFPECANGACKLASCDIHWYNLDNLWENGCECENDQYDKLGTGNGCANAVDLGTLPDSGKEVSVTGRLVPGEDEDWFTFKATDSNNTDCDKFHMRAYLFEGSQAYALTVLKDGCDVVDNLFCAQTENAEFKTDFYLDKLGECPCSTETGPPGLGHIGAPNSGFCTDNSATYFVKVVRKTGVAAGCQNYRLIVSNGIKPL